MSSQIANRPAGEVAIYKAEYFFEKLGLTNEWEKEKGFALQAMQGNDTLAKCAPDSIVKAVANVALTGLSLDPSRKLAYLIPRGGQAILQPSYRGLMKSVTSSGTVIAFEAKVVYKGDDFQFQEGSDPFIKHQSLDLKEDLTTDDLKLLTEREQNPYKAMRCAYSVAILPEGVRSFVIMPRWRIDKIKACAKGTDRSTSPWKAWPEEQIRKTVLAYHTKTLDVGEKAAQAVQLFHDNDGLEKIAEEVRGLHAMITDNSQEGVEVISDSQIADLEGLISEVKGDVENLCSFFKIRNLEALPVSSYEKAVKMLENKRSA